MISNTLKLAQFNILKGGEGRLEYISNAISLLNVDICGILEAVGWQNNPLFWKEYGEQIGFNHFNIAIANTKYNIALFSKYPIEIISLNKGFKHVVLKVKILKEIFSDIDLFFVHLSPVSEDERLLEVETLFKNFETSSKVIIMGDLNSLSEQDSYNENQLLNFFRKNNIKKYGEEYLRYDVIAKLESYGFIDVMKLFKKEFDYSVPTLQNSDINHNEKLRIDYAFVTKQIMKNCVDCKIVKGAIYDKASDHYPLILDYKI